MPREPEPAAIAPVAREPEPEAPTIDEIVVSDEVEIVAPDVGVSHDPVVVAPPEPAEPSVELSFGEPEALREPEALQEPEPAPPVLETVAVVAPPTSVVRAATQPSAREAPTAPVVPPPTPVAAPTPPAKPTAPEEPVAPAAPAAPAAKAPETFTAEGLPPAQGAVRVVELPAPASISLREMLRRSVALTLRKPS
jgi:hypothetical protein